MLPSSLVSPSPIAKIAAKGLAEKQQKIIVVEDSGLFIKELKDFPGTCSAYIHQRIGLNGILKLMENVKYRSAIYKSAVAYCEPGKRPVSFIGSENGKISKEVRGTNSWGHDSIFIPEGSDETYGEITNTKEIKRFRRRAVEKLKSYVLKQ